MGVQIFRGHKQYVTELRGKLDTSCPKNYHYSLFSRSCTYRRERRAVATWGRLHDASSGVYSSMHERVLRISASTLVRLSLNLLNRLQGSCLKKWLYHACTSSTSTNATRARARVRAEHVDIVSFFSEIEVYPSIHKEDRSIFRAQKRSRLKRIVPIQWRKWKNLCKVQKTAKIMFIKSVITYCLKNLLHISIVLNLVITTLSP